MKTKLRSLAPALLAASTLCLSTLSVCAQNTSISAAEFQRMVYSAHLLTQLDEKPELDASLQVLLELQRRNPHANPLALADVSREALARYRTNAPAYIRTFGFQDEVLAAYLEALRQVPARTNFVQANLSLLNHFMLDPNENTNSTTAELFHSANQRLLNSEKQGSQRQVLVDSCISRARHSGAFAAAVDSLLVPNETSVLVADSPAAIIGNTNSALYGNTTMQTLLALSLGSGDGSVTVSSNQLMNLFTNETRAIWDTINTNLALEVEFNQGQPDLLSYLTNQAAISAQAAREAVVKQGQSRKLASASAAILVQSKLMAARPTVPGILPKLPGWMQTTAEGLATMAGGFTDKNKVAGGLKVVAGGLKLFGVAAEEDAESTDEKIVREIGNVKALIGDLSTNLNYRFDRVDQSLVTIFDTLNTEFEKIQIGQTAQGQQITNILGNLSDIRSSLLLVQQDLHRLERQLFESFNGLARQNLVSAMEGGLFYETGNPGPMTWPEYGVGSAAYENTFYNYAVNFSDDFPASPYNFTLAELADSALHNALSGAVRPLDANLNYVKEFLRERLVPNTEKTPPLANPRDWFTSAYAYLQLGVENPNHYRTKPDGAAQVQRIMNKGVSLTNFFRSLTFSGGTINGPLYNALTNYYAVSLPPFANQVHASEQQYATSINFNLNTWRQWSAAAPRITASATELLIVPEPLPLIPREPATRISCGLNHSLAVKSDGTVAAWGFNGNEQISVPPGLNNVVDVAGGDYHSLALRNDGTIVGWGYNGNGETTIPSSATSVTAIAAGSSHNLALRENGTVVGWGDNTYGQTNSPTIATNVTGIAAGGYHSLALRSGGTVVAWGAGTNNTGASFQYGQAIVPAGLAGVTQVAGGVWHSLALRQDGTVAAWGNNFFGQTNVPPSATNVMAIAAGDFHNLVLKSNGTVVGWGGISQTPTKIPIGLTNVIAIAAGYSHSLALKADGTVVVWGDIALRQGVVPPALTWRGAIAPGESHILALKANGTLLAWGNNSDGQTNIPPSATNVVAIAAGDFHSLALKADGTVVGWGLNNRGQTTTPPSATNVVAIAAGYVHSLALKADGTIQAWGGSTGNGEKDIPASATNVVAIAAGGSQSLALKTDGTVIGWGKDNGGLFALAPVPAGLSNVIAIAASGNGNRASCLALKADGTIVGWGNNDFGQINIPPGTTNVMGIAASYLGGLALKADSTVVGWGQAGNASAINVVAVVAGYGYRVALRADGTFLEFNNGRLVVPMGLTDVTAISGGEYHSLALKADGTVVGWGYNDFGQLDIPTGLTNVVKVAAGSDHSLALKGDGTVLAWGRNDSGEINVPPSATNVVAVAAGYGHSLALKADGTVIGWGATAVPGNATNMVAIAAGGSYDLAVRADGTVIRWGSDTVVPASATNVMAVAAGGSHTLALRADRTVIVWGNNTAGQTNIPPTATNVVAIAAGAEHSLALRADGSVVGWGRNTSGQINIPPAATNVVAIAAGAAYSLFLQSDSGGSAGKNLTLARAEIPRRVESLFKSVNSSLLASMQPLGSNYTNAFALSGPKALLTAVLELGMPYTLERDDVLHGFIYGTESLMDHETAQMFLQPQAGFEISSQGLAEVAVLRYQRFQVRLTQRLADLQATGQAEIPRLAGHTLRLLDLLRDAWATVPPSSLEIGRKTNGVGLVLYGEPYARYTLLQSSSPSGSWTTNITNLRSVDSPIGTVDPTLPLPVEPQRYYRAVQPVP